MIFWLLSYWFNCLFPPEPCLFIALWRASDCSHYMHANPTHHEPQLPLSLNTSLISLCLKSGTTQSWQVGKIPPSITLLNIFCTPFIDLPKAVMGVSRFMQKSCHCSLMTVSLTIQYGYIPEDSLSLWATVHANTLKWSYSIEIGEMCIWMKAWKSENVWPGKQHILHKRLEEND